MDDVDVLACENFAEVPVTLYARIDLFETVLEVLFVHVANGEQFGRWINGLKMALAHATDSDDGFGEDFIGGGKALTAEDMARHNSQRSERNEGGLEEVPTGEQ